MYRATRHGSANRSLSATGDGAGWAVLADSCRRRKGRGSPWGASDRWRSKRRHCDPSPGKRGARRRTATGRSLTPRAFDILDASSRRWSTRLSYAAGLRL